MRRASTLIWDTWNQGKPLVGDLKACTRVTVEVDWYLKTFSPAARPKKKNPIRWWQDAGNAQIETEIPAPFIRKVDIDRSIDTDAAECQISMLNVAMEENTAGAEGGPPRIAPTTLGIPGYFTFDHGERPGPWDHQKNEWYDVIIPGALLRTYQGYGGHAPTPIRDAQEAGNLILTGVWIIDDVGYSPDGQLVIYTRDMAALLIDQSLYPPLVPNGFYPLTYRRWIYGTRTIKPPPRNAGSSGTVGRKRLKYRTSSADAWYGPNANIHGHTGSMAVDGNPASWALGEGNSNPARPFADNYWEFDCGETINQITLQCWKGGYDTYVSILENGRWLGADTIPYDHTPLIGHQPHVVDTGADIPYVMKFGADWEKAQTVRLPRAYRAERVRITFRNLVQTEWGPWTYRGGIREVYAEFNTGGPGGSEAAPLPLWVDICPHPSGYGYWCVRSDGWIEPFGDAHLYGLNGDPSARRMPTGKDLSRKRDSGPAVSIVSSPSGNGYAVLTTGGKVFCFGDFVNYGGVVAGSTDAVAIIPTYTGNGYWIVRASGSIDNRGDAPEYTNFGATADAAGHPHDYGLWAVGPGGHVDARGAAVVHGVDGQRVNWSLDFAGIAADGTGDGYYITEEFGEVGPRGDAPNYGAQSGFPPPPYPSGSGAPPKEPRISAIAVSPIGGGPEFTTQGYATLTYDGRIFGKGGWVNLGQPAGGTVQTRRPGDYTDYSQIIKDICMWSGFYFHGGHPPGTKPVVYGNIEQTGVYSDETLKPDFFDKKAPIEPITQIKEIVAYNFYVDPEGAVRFEAPNFWKAGNFYEDGSPIDIIPTVDERVNMTDWKPRITRKNERSAITVGTDDPLDKIPGSVSVTVHPANLTSARSFLRGMTRPAQLAIPNNVTVTKREMKIMAELTGLRIFFARRAGTVSCLANPAICIDDQVRLLERVSGELYIHYVRSVRTSHDLSTGEYTMDLETSWLGTDSDDWVISYSGADVTAGGFVYYKLSADTTSFVQKTNKGTAAGRAALTPVDLVDVDTLPADEGAAT